MSKQQRNLYVGELVTTNDEALIKSRGFEKDKKYKVTCVSNDGKIVELEYMDGQFAAKDFKPVK